MGETFSCYVSVHNDSEISVQDVVVKVSAMIGINSETYLCVFMLFLLLSIHGSFKVELRTSSQNISLTKSDEGIAQRLDSNQSCDLVVHHEVKELGHHKCFHHVA